MTETGLVMFLSGAVTTLDLVAAGFFAKFWRRTREPLFIGFSVAFLLLACSQLISSWLGVSDERSVYAYLPRAAGFIVIMFAIMRANWRRR